ncbi:Sodium bicarbonate transporter-like protein 11 [Taenia crassiceps]|uniref:Sodium bicarbonate transporter-like protein 11 n=1 Tax=Taenia crassiceps TaxID=6207 RepID=A0ABR4Q0V9_9CEST
MSLKGEDFLHKTATIPSIMTRNSESPESPESPLPRDRPSMQLLTLPPSGRNYSRNCSIASYRSEDALSNLSLGSLLPPDLDDEILSCHPSCLVLSQLQNLPLKDFSAEVRANMDIKMFIKGATLLLDLEASSIEEILHNMLEAVFTETSGHANHTATTLSGGSGMHRQFLTPNHSPHSSTLECEESQHVTNSSVINNSGGHVHSRSHTLTRTSGSGLFAAATKLPAVNRVELIEEAKKALLLEIRQNDLAYRRLSKTIKSVSFHENEGITMDQSWICALCSLKNIQKRYLALARLAYPVNLGRSNEGTQIILLVISPQKEKKTKCEIELGRTFATILSDLEFRRQLIYAQDEEEVKALLCARAHELEEEHEQLRHAPDRIDDLIDNCLESRPRCQVMSGLIADLQRRLPLYPSDFIDGVRGNHTARKVTSSVFFLYFACLLPSIAFGVLNYNNTCGKIGVFRILLSQTIGGLCFGLTGGQPLTVLLTTAPIAIYVKLIYTVTESYNLEFYAFFGCVGLFNAGFLFIYAALDASRIMRWSTRSTEEIFAMFVSIAFLVEAYRDTAKEFRTYYFDCISAEQCRSASENGAVVDNANITLLNLHPVLFTTPTTFVSSVNDSRNATKAMGVCKPEVAILYLLLLACTYWICSSMLNFTKTPFLTETKRELIHDFALPSAVLVMSFVGSYLFRKVELKPYSVDMDTFEWKVIDFRNLNWLNILGAMGLSFPLSLLFFMEQNIASVIVNSPSNKLKKGTSYHWDLFVVGVINTLLSLFGLPWVHGALPQSPMHVRSLADMEERITVGNNVQQIVARVRETRITAILAHIGIGLSILMLPIPLTYIPRPVLAGLFVYMAVTSVSDNQLWERIQLVFIEQSAYPPSHYIRRVPQRRMHLFTGLQLLQLAILCSCGFAEVPFIKMVFPILLFLQILVRHRLIPYVIDRKYLEAMDRPM